MSREVLTNHMKRWKSLLGIGAVTMFPAAAIHGGSGEISAFCMTGNPQNLKLAKNKHTRNGS
jgi:hypothetical protein